MPIKEYLARIVHRIERKIDVVRRKPDATDAIIDAYGGFTPEGQIVLRGRVLAAARRLTARDDQSRLRNARDFLQLFMTDEIADMTVTVPDTDTQTVTDEEGFFTLICDWPQDSIPPVMQVTIGTSDRRFDMPVYPSQDCRLGVISDIDDTIMQTGAFSLIRNLWTSITGNMLTRHVFPDAIKMLQGFAGQNACFFYVSSSPWNMHAYLMAIFKRNAAPEGPLFLRDLGVSETQFITGTHGDHKTQAIVEILQAHPHLPFVLVGDTGQHDPHIYADIASDYPDRIAQVIFRKPQPGDLTKAVQDDLNRIKANTELTIGYDYAAVLASFDAA